MSHTSNNCNGGNNTTLTNVIQQSHRPNIYTPPPEPPTNFLVRAGPPGLATDISHLCEGETMMILVQDPAYMAQIVKEGLDQASESLEMHVGAEKLWRTQLIGNTNLTHTEDLGSLMGQTFQSNPFFPSYSYLPSNQSLRFVPLVTSHRKSQLKRH